MDLPGGYYNKGMICLVEVLGTAILLININLGGLLHPGFGVFAGGFTIFVLIVIWGNVSGGHFNPAVTMAIYVKDGFFNRKNAGLSMVIMVS